MVNYDTKVKQNTPTVLADLSHECVPREAVIMNEHLMEALRRLRRSSSDTNVDRRLVTNVLLSFLTTPRADSKRFEMLSLLSTILSWTDDEREKAGLQHKGGAVPTSSSAVSSIFGRSSPKGKSPELEKTDETEVRRYDFVLLHDLMLIIVLSWHTVILSPMG